MSKIIKLDKKLANQIAAGEVVERPVSVVKELVENSIDAGAKNIKIEIVGGGIEKIVIQDDGEGIEKDDFELVVEKYSTSKIKDLQDLYNVMTFGFRGEALASISSVSDLEIYSKTKDSKNGYLLEVIGGDKKELKEYPFEKGTKIVVNNLFYNTPARLNYLKKPRTEYSHVFEFLNSIALSYPEIGFEFISDSKLVFKYNFGEDLKIRIYNVYKDDFSENLLELNFSLIGINIKGYISDPKVSFANKNRQNLFVNNRVIKSNLIYKAINDAYNRYIPHSQFPAYVINLEIDPTQVDVNVHPRKLEVRFAGESDIFRAFYHAVNDKLEKVSLIGNENNLGVNLCVHPNISEVKNEYGNIKKGEHIGSPLQQKYYTGSGTKFKSYSPYSDKTSNPSQFKVAESIDFTKKILDNNSEFDIISNDLHDTSLGKIIGQAHNSYIIVETTSGIKFLDQHALAERIIYEKLVKKESEIQSQGLLIGESIDLTPKEFNILEENEKVFEEMGFDLEKMSGNNIIINAIPDFIKKENIKKIFLLILDDISSGIKKSTTIEEVKNKIFAYTACRSAIKFGNKLNLFEMNKLLNDSVLDYSSTCPHGRPVVFEIGLNELKDKYER